MTETLFSRTLEDGTRFYDWKGESAVSVTTAIKDGLAKPGLVDWAAKQVAKDASDNVEYLSTIPTKKSRLQWLLDRFNEGRSKSSETGTTIHGHADNLAVGYPEEVYTEEVQPFMTSFNAFLNDWNPRFIDSEAFVFSRKYGYGGTLDAIVEIEKPQLTGRFVLDIKTGNSVWPEVGLQLAAYSRADFLGRKSGEEAELPVLHPTRGLVLHLRPDKYTFRPVRIDSEVFDAFLACLDMHHYVKNVQHFILGAPLSHE